MCSNWMITLLSLIIVVFALWPALASATVVMWVTAIAGLLIIILVWSGCSCKWCQMDTKKKKR